MSTQNLPVEAHGQAPVQTCPSRQRAGDGQVSESSVNPQVNNPFTCPSESTGRSRAGKSATCPSAPPPYKGAGGGAGGQGYLPEFELERNAARRRAATKTLCSECGTPTWTGPDDTPSGPQTKTVTLDRGRLTRLGMYQAATSGRRIYTLRHTKTGPSIDWLGEIARPQPDRDHLLVAHGCGLPDLDTQPEPPPADPNGPCPF